MNELSWAWYFAHFALVGACIGLIYTVFEGDREPVLASLGFSGIAFSATFCGIVWLGDAFKRVGLKGKDVSKKNKPELYVICLPSNSPAQMLNELFQTGDNGSCLCDSLPVCHDSILTVSLLRVLCGYDIRWR